MSYFSYLIKGETSGTVILYTIILFVSFVAACFSQRTIYKTVSTKSNSKVISIKFNKVWFIVSFIILWFFYVFNNTGADIQTYLLIFEHSSSESLSNIFLEFGYRVLNILIKTFVNNSFVGIGIIKTLVLIILYSALYYYRYDIHIGVAVLAYTSLFYFQSFNLIRVTLAGMLCLLSVCMWDKRRKMLCIICVIFAITIHYTSLVILFTWVIYYLYHKAYKQTRIVWLIAIATVVLTLGNSIINKLVTVIPYFSKYAVYLDTSVSGGTGIAQYVFYIPIFICLYYAYKSERDNTLVEISSIWTIEGLCIAILGYGIGMLSRLSIYFCFTFVIFIPYFINRLRLKKGVNDHKRFPLAYNTTLFFAVLYFVIRFIMYISSGLYQDGIENYIFFMAMIK